MINAVGQTHVLAQDIDLQLGICEQCHSVHVVVEGLMFGCDLQIQDAESARAIAKDLLEAADVIEARVEATKPEKPRQLKLVEN